MKVVRPIRSLLPIALLTAAFCSFTAMAASTNHYYVKAGNLSPSPPYRTWGDAATNIQSAVAQAETDWNANTNFIVWVTNGTYSLTNSITLTKAITVRSVNGRTNTLVNGNYPAYTNRCFYITGNAVLDGFTISNGYAFGASPANRGGGVYAYACTAQVQNCSILMNRSAGATGSTGVGAGMAMTDGATIVSNCLIAKNDTRTDGSGTGLYINNCSGRVIDCVISNNVQTGTGGTGAGVYMSAVNAVVSNCIMVANSSSRYGANYTSAGTFTHCIFTNNYARSSGGGLQLHTSTAGSRLLYSTVTRNRSGGEGSGGVSINRGTIHNSIIIHNYTSGNGGGVNNNEGYLKNCLIAGNISGGYGGGLYRGSQNETIHNCTIVRNSAGTAGGGIYSMTTNIPNLYLNNIIYYNQAAGITNDIASGIANWRDNFSYNCSPDLVAGINHNITNTPQFDYPGSGYGTNAVLGDYILFKSSPCEDAGTNQTWMTTTLTTDLAGYPRIIPEDGAVNMGAYEHTIGKPGGIFTIL